MDRVFVNTGFTVVAGRILGCMAEWFVGTSGFSYPEWKGDFYPKDLPADQMLHHYSRVLRTVEINNTFYRFPAVALVDEWRSATPGGFRFSVKAHRLITHIKRLTDVGDAVRTQLERVAVLGDRAGPLLFQFPPSLRRDVPLLADFLLLLPTTSIVVEFRHRSWYADDVYAALTARGASMAIMEADDDAPVLEFVGPLLYLRLHRSSYAPEDLRVWTDRIRAALEAGKDAYAYFTHEDGAPAPAYARHLQDMIGAV
jgi:uncharacterized protein YecE (DUF72 family)